MGLRLKRRHAGLLRIGVGHGAAQPFTAQDHAEAMLLDWLDKHFDARDADLAQLQGQRRAFFRGDATGATIGDVALAVERHKVAAHSHVLGTELEADAGRFQCAAADHIFQGIVAEQAHVAGTAAGRNAGQHRDGTAERADLGQGIEVGRLGRFEFRRTARRHRQAAQAVGHEEDDFGVIFGLEFADQLLSVEHGYLFPGRFCIEYVRGHYWKWQQSRPSGSQNTREPHSAARRRQRN